MDGNKFGVCAYVFEGCRDRFLPRGTPFHHVNCLTEFFLPARFFQASNFVGAGGKNDVGDRIARCEPAQCMKKDGRAIQFKELFGRFAAHARAHSSGGQNGSDSGH